MWHIVFAVKGRFQAFRDQAELRRVARAIARVVGGRLLTWALPGDHLHLLLVGGRAEVGRLGRDLRFALRAIGVELVSPYFREVTGRDDLERVVAYHLRQARKHDACERPALFDGGCFVDLVGARVLDGYDPDRLLAHLPRFDLARHLDEVAARALPRAAEAAEIRAGGASRLVAAAGAALAVGPPLRGNAPAVVAARRVVMSLGTDAGINVSELAFALDITRQAAGRLARRPREPRWERAVRLRLGLEEVAMVVVEAGGRRG